MSESPGTILAERDIRRRWLTSAAIVVLLHAGLAVGVLTWRHMRAVPPVEIDLTPSPPASGPSEAQATPPAAAPETAPAPPSTQSAITSSEQNAQQNVAEPGQGGGATETASGMTAPQLPPSPRGMEADSASGFASGGAPPAISPRIGSAAVTAPAANTPALNGVTAGSPRPPGPALPSPESAGPRPSSAMANMPLDTSITAQPPVHGNGAIGPLASRETGPLDRKPISEFHPARPFGVPDIARNSVPGIHGANGANGAHVQDRARAAMTRMLGRAETPKTAIGSSATVIASRGEATGLNAGVTRNAIGVTANFRPRIPRVGATDSKTGIAAAAGRAMPAAPVINGHGFARTAVGPAMIGGPARATGALNGNDFHLRH